MRRDIGRIRRRVLPAEAIARLEAATEFDMGFPSGFIAETAPWVLGEADRVERVTERPML